MIVLVANSLPPAVRGKLKLWFEEPPSERVCFGDHRRSGRRRRRHADGTLSPGFRTLDFQKYPSGPSLSHLRERHADETFDVHIRTAADYRKISTDRTWLFDK